MAELKTKPTQASVKSFLNSIADDQRRKDCQSVLKMMQDATGAKPQMWGPSIVGFGSYHYKSESGREGDWFLTGFSPRKQALTLYIMGGFGRHDRLMRKLGKCRTGSGCLYVKSLANVDLDALRQLINLSVGQMKQSQA
ncbi:MAG: DUF1801 domain-containing protein [Terriglobales bacterium]